MPVLESTEFTTPRSALRHRPIGDDGTKPEKHTANAPIPPVQRASRTRPTDSQVEVDEWEREAGNASTKTQERPSVRRSSTKAYSSIVLSWFGNVEYVDLVDSGYGCCELVRYNDG